MLLSKTVFIKITSNMCKRYKELGYIFKCNDIIEVKIEDLPLQSNKNVLVKCDCCGKEYKMPYYTYTKINGEVICKECYKTHREKAKKTCIERYGCENPFQNEEIREKQRKTIVEKYGCNNVFQNDNIKRKIKDSLIERYGVDHPMHNDTIKDIVLRKTQEKRSKNGTAPYSKQQKYLCDLYNGKLNYLLDVLWLDIYFEKENIYCEYDGSGHDILVKYKQISQKEFDLKQLKRSKFLKSKGLKEFRIVSKKDFIPNDSILINMKNLAFYILQNNISNYIIFDIDNHKIYYNNFEIDYNYLDDINLINKIAL